MPIYKIQCGKCDHVENRNDNKVPVEVAVVMQGSCLACTPDSIMTSYYYLDSAGDRVGQDAAKGVK